MGENTVLHLQRMDDRAAMRRVTLCMDRRGQLTSFTVSDISDNRGNPLFYRHPRQLLMMMKDMCENGFVFVRPPPWYIPLFCPDPPPPVHYLFLSLSFSPSLSPLSLHTLTNTKCKKCIFLVSFSILKCVCDVCPHVGDLHKKQGGSAVRVVVACCQVHDPKGGTRNIL